MEGTSLLPQVICQSHKISRGPGVGLLQDHRGPTRAQIEKQEHKLAKTNKKGNQRNIRSVITEQLYRKENLVGNTGLGRIIKCHFTKCRHSL